MKQPPFSLFRKLREQSWLPACVTRCVNCVDDTVVDAAFLPRLDVHRRALRLQLCPNGEYRDYFLCERSLLFVPEWFAPPQADAWPRGLSQVGWPLEDDEPNPEPPNPEPTAPSIPDALARWLEETAPKYGRTIVFLCGTGNPRHASDFFAAAAAIVARMNKSYRDRDLPSKFRVIVDDEADARGVPDGPPEFPAESPTRDRGRAPPRARRSGRLLQMHRDRARRRRRDPRPR